MKFEVAVAVLVAQSHYYFAGLDMNFGEALRRRMSQAFDCSEIQSQRLTSDKLPCFILI